MRERDLFEAHDVLRSDIVDLLTVGVPRDLFIADLRDSARGGFTFADLLTLTPAEDDDLTDLAFADRFARLAVSRWNWNTMSALYAVSRILTTPEPADRPDWLLGLTGLPLRLIVLLRGWHTPNDTPDFFSHLPYRQMLTDSYAAVRLLTHDQCHHLFGRGRDSVLTDLDEVAMSFPSLRRRILSGEANHPGARNFL